MCVCLCQSRTSSFWCAKHPIAGPWVAAVWWILLSFLKMERDKRSDVFMDAIITVLFILFIKIQTKASLPCPHVFSKCLPQISKSTTQLKFTQRCSSQMVKNYILKTKKSNTTETIKMKPQPPCPPPALTACWSVHQLIWRCTRLPPPPFSFLFNCRC